MAIKKSEKAVKEIEQLNATKEKYDSKLKKAAVKGKFKSKLGIIKFPTYTKNLVFVVILMCIIDLQLTYVLAFLGMPTIAEELSKQLCITILGVAFTYMVRAYFDSKAEHNNLDKKFTRELSKMAKTKSAELIGEVATNLGLEIPGWSQDEEEPSEENLN